jgi:hypothetical protein
MNPLTEAREAIAKMLEASGFTVHAAPPETLSGPAAVVVPGDPWIQKLALDAWQVNLVVNCYVTANGTNLTSVADLEDKIWRLGEHLSDAGFGTMQITPLQVQTNGNTNLVTASIPVAVKVTQ